MHRFSAIDDNLAMPYAYDKATTVRIRRVLRYALTLVLFVVPASYAQVAGGLGRYESRYYIVETNLPADRARMVGRVMDATGQEYNRRFQGFRGVVRRKPTVRVYATKDEYLRAYALACGEPNEHSVGIHCSADGIVYTYDREHLARTLMHECFHQFAAQVIDGELPRWVDEGLAEYFEEGIYEKKTGRLRLGAAPAWRIKLLVGAAKKNALFPLDRLMHLTGAEWHSHMGNERGRVQYSQAWLLCHFLIHGEGGKYQALFETFLRHIDGGLDADTAFKRVFGEGTRALQEKLAAYMDRLAPEATESTGGD